MSKQMSDELNTKEKDIFDEWNNSECVDEVILARILTFIEEKEYRKEYDEAHITALLALEKYSVSLSAKR